MTTLHPPVPTATPGTIETLADVRKVLAQLDTTLTLPEVKAELARHLLDAHRTAGEPVTDQLGLVLE